MQILITHVSLARTRVQRFNRWRLGAALLGPVLVLTLISGRVYNFVFLEAAREGWSVVSQLVKFVVRDEFAPRDRFMRENLDAMAQKVGKVQAKLIKLEAMGEPCLDSSWREAGRTEGRAESGRNGIAARLSRTKR